MGWGGVVSQRAETVSFQIIYRHSLQAGNLTALDGWNLELPCTTELQWVMEHLTRTMMPFHPLEADEPPLLLAF